MLCKNKNKNKKYINNTKLKDNLIVNQKNINKTPNTNEFIENSHNYDLAIDGIISEFNLLKEQLETLLTQKEQNEEKIYEIMCTISLEYESLISCFHFKEANVIYNFITNLIIFHDNSQHFNYYKIFVDISFKNFCFYKVLNLYNNDSLQDFISKDDFLSSSIMYMFLFLEKEEKIIELLEKIDLSNEDTSKFYSNASLLYSVFSLYFKLEKYDCIINIYEQKVYGRLKNINDENCQIYFYVLHSYFNKGMYDKAYKLLNEIGIENLTKTNKRAEELLKNTLAMYNSYNAIKNITKDYNSYSIDEIDNYYKIQDFNFIIKYYNEVILKKENEEQDINILSLVANSYYNTAQYEMAERLYNIVKNNEEFKICGIYFKINLLECLILTEYELGKYDIIEDIFYQNNYCLSKSLIVLSIRFEIYFKKQQYKNIIEYQKLLSPEHNINNELKSIIFTYCLKVYNKMQQFDTTLDLWDKYKTPEQLIVSDIYEAMYAYNKQQKYNDSLYLYRKYFNFISYENQKICDCMLIAIEAFYKLNNDVSAIELFNFVYLVKEKKEFDKNLFIDVVQGLSLYLFNKNKINEAVEIYEKALQNSKNYEFLLEISKISYSTFNGLTFVGEKLKNDKQLFQNIISGLILYFYEKNKKDEAIKLYEKYLTYVININALIKISKIYYDKKEYNKILQIQQYITNNHYEMIDDDYKKILIKSYYKTKHYSEALDVCNQIKDNIDIEIDELLINFHLKKYEEAKKIYNKLNTVKKQNKDVMYVILNIYYIDKNKQEFIKMYKQYYNNINIQNIEEIHKMFILLYSNDIKTYKDDIINAYQKIKKTDIKNSCEICQIIIEIYKINNNYKNAILLFNAMDNKENINSTCINSIIDLIIKNNKNNNFTYILEKLIDYNNIDNEAIAKLFKFFFNSQRYDCVTNICNKYLDYLIRKDTINELIQFLYNKNEYNKISEIYNNKKFIKISSFKILQQTNIDYIIHSLFYIKKYKSVVDACISYDINFCKHDDIFKIFVQSYYISNNHTENIELLSISYSQIIIKIIDTVQFSNKQILTTFYNKIIKSYKDKYIILLENIINKMILFNLINENNIYSIIEQNYKILNYHSIQNIFNYYFITKENVFNTQNFINNICINNKYDIIIDIYEFLKKHNKLNEFIVYKLIELATNNGDFNKLIEIYNTQNIDLYVDKIKIINSIIKLFEKHNNVMEYFIYERIKNEQLFDDQYQVLKNTFKTKGLLFDNVECNILFILKTYENNLYKNQQLTEDDKRLKNAILEKINIIQFGDSYEDTDSVLDVSIQSDFSNEEYEIKYQNFDTIKTYFNRKIEEDFFDIKTINYLLEEMLKENQKTKNLVDKDMIKIYEIICSKITPSQKMFETIEKIFNSIESYHDFIEKKCKNLDITTEQKIRRFKIFLSFNNNENLLFNHI